MTYLLNSGTVSQRLRKWVFKPVANIVPRTSRMATFPIQKTGKKKEGKKKRGEGKADQD